MRCPAHRSLTCLSPTDSPLLTLSLPSCPPTQSMKFPAEFGTKVDLRKVNWDAMKPWIAKRITELLGGLEDDVLIAYVVEQLEGKTVRGGGRD